MYCQYCPICGKKGTICIAPGIRVSEQHRCDERTLQGIDAAMKQDRDHGRRQAIDERLSIGFEMMKD